MSRMKCACSVVRRELESELLDVRPGEPVHVDDVHGSHFGEAITVGGARTVCPRPGDPVSRARSHRSRDPSRCTRRRVRRRTPPTRLWVTGGDAGGMPVGRSLPVRAVSPVPETAQKRASTNAADHRSPNGWSHDGYVTVGSPQVEAPGATHLPVRPASVARSASTFPAVDEAHTFSASARLRRSMSGVTTCAAMDVAGVRLARPNQFDHIRTIDGGDPAKPVLAHEGRLHG